MNQRESAFCCPLCQDKLRRQPNTNCLRCDARHSFDFAAQGYVHLLPVHRMHAKIPGDNKEMVAARRRFFDTGCYRPFCEAIASLCAEQCKQLAAPVVLDAGCGEGYYTEAVRLALQNERARVCGFDIAKFAVLAAAKRYPALELAVASCFSIPVQNQSVDLLLSIFSPIVPEEFARALRPGGSLVLAVAAPRHLFGLKEVLYEHPYENETKDTDYPGFSFVQRIPLRITATLRGQQTIADLFAMTPYYWKTSPEGAKRLTQCESLFTELGFDLLLYRRTEESL